MTKTERDSILYITTQFSKFGKPQSMQMHLIQSQNRQFLNWKK